MPSGKLTAVLLLAALALAACTAPTPPPDPTPPADQFPVVAEARLTPRQSVQLAFVAGGVVAEVLFAEGESVGAGEVIARLKDSPALAAEIARAELELLTARMALADLQAPPAEREVAEAALAILQAQKSLEAAERRLRNLRRADTTYYQQRVAEAEHALATAEQNARITDIGSLAASLAAARYALEGAAAQLNTLRDLEARYPGGFTDAIKEAQQAYDQIANQVEVLELQLEQTRAASATGVTQAEAALETARANLTAAQSGPDPAALALAQAEVKVAAAALAEAEARAVRLAAGPDPDELALARSRLRAAEAALAAAQDAAADRQLRAPFAGTLVSLNIRVGEQVGAGQSPGTLADLSGWLLETNSLTETDVVRVTVGQRATVALDALPETPLEGVVISIGGLFVDRGGEVTYPVRLELTEGHPQLRRGMTAQVTFDR